MDDGISEIKLLPSWSRSTVLKELKSAIAKAHLLQAGVAYWTVYENLLGPQLSRVLSRDGAFLCVDLHPPTEIDALADLVRKGAHIYLYCEDIPTFSETGRKEPAYLLHTKLLFFWSSDRSVELWVGSHNWTNRALAGLNIEASIMLRGRDSATVCSDAAQYLEKIRQFSQPFDLSKIEFYKQAQRNMLQRTTPFIELEGIGAALLANMTFALFGTDSGDLDDLGTVGRDVYVSVFESDFGTEYLYPATILHSGLLAGSHQSAGGISFSPRRYAFRRGRRFPMLQPEGEVGRDVLASAQYFVTLNLQKLDTSVTAEVVPPRTAAWTDVGSGQSAALNRLGTDSRDILFRGKDPQPRRPRFQEAPSRTLSLSDRRELAELPLVTRRILRLKS